MQKRYPNQTGKNLRYPTVEKDLPPDIENKTSSGQNQGNLKTLHSTRAIYMQA